MSDIVERLHLALKIGLHPEMNLLDEAANEIKRLRAEIAEAYTTADVYAAGRIHGAELGTKERKRLEAEIERLRAGLREILAFDIEARFDAKASYTTRKAEEWRDLCGKARRLLGEEK